MRSQTLRSPPLSQVTRSARWRTSPTLTALPASWNAPAQSTQHPTPTPLDSPTSLSRGAEGGPGKILSPLCPKEQGKMVKSSNKITGLALWQN